MRSGLASQSGRGGGSPSTCLGGETSFAFWIAGGRTCSPFSRWLGRVEGLQQAHFLPPFLGPLSPIPPHTPCSRCGEVGCILPPHTHSFGFLPLGWVGVFWVRCRACQARGSPSLFIGLGLGFPGAAILFLCCWLGRPF